MQHECFTSARAYEFTHSFVMDSVGGALEDANKRYEKLADLSDAYDSGEMSHEQIEVALVSLLNGAAV